MTTEAPIDLTALERRRRLSLRASAIALTIAVAGFPLGMSLGGSNRDDTAGGAVLLAAIAGIIAAPWIVRAWQSFMRRRMMAAAASGRADLRHIDGENDRAAREQALSSDAFSLAAFRDSGLVERFDAAGVNHILVGEAQGVPFTVAEMTLLDAKGYRLFGGVLASFQLAHPRSGLTIVTRDHGILGNLIAGAGSAIERLPLEDPAFEGVFEVYGTDQVGGRVVLTTTMLERLKTLDEIAHARGFACAFLEDHLLIAFNGMSWRCPPWRILEPVDRWLQDYVARLTGLMDLPVAIVHTLNLAVPLHEWPAIPSAGRMSVPISGGDGEVFTSAIWRLVGEGGLPLASVASGALFGGVALVGAWYGLKVGYSSRLFWSLWVLIAAGLAYGAVAIARGVREIAALAWRWDAPLRTLKRP
jgi:hypothetical protein